MLVHGARALHLHVQRPLTGTTAAGTSARTSPTTTAPRSAAARTSRPGRRPATRRASRPARRRPRAATRAARHRAGGLLLRLADAQHLQDVASASSGSAARRARASTTSSRSPDIPIAADGSFSATATTTACCSASRRTSRTRSAATSTASTPRACRGWAARSASASPTTTAPRSTAPSNAQTWNTTRDAQGAQTGGPPPPGTYSGGTSQGRGGLVLRLRRPRAPAGRERPIVGLGCTPSKSFYDQLAIPDIAIAADGSFSATTTQDGVLFGAPAHFTYTFSGHVHGPTQPASPARRARSASASPTTTAPRSTAPPTPRRGARCATRRAPARPRRRRPGSYSGGTSQGRAVSFYVSTDGTRTP